MTGPELEDSALRSRLILPMGTSYREEESRGILSTPAGTRDMVEVGELGSRVL